MQLWHHLALREILSLFFLGFSIDCGVSNPKCYIPSRSLKSVHVIFIVNFFLSLSCLLSRWISFLFLVALTKASRQSVKCGLDSQ